MLNLTISLIHKVVLTLTLLLISLNSSAQLGFCSGNSGDSIFTEDFGIAPSSALQNTQLTSGTTTYSYLGATVFGDGKYTVSNSTDYWNWFDASGYSFQDHTPNDTNGRMLIVNASFDAGEFFSLPVNGLCENTTYEFSSWLVNLTPRDLLVNGNLPNPCNVSFEIWDSSDTTQLASGNTGDFLGGLSTETAQWIQSALVFQTLPGQTSVILKMVNNGVGGYGNDLAIDDIVFKSCGDYISINDEESNANITICSSQVPYATTLTVTPDFSVFSTHFYQWQESLDGAIWTDISSETLENINVTGINATTYYRSKVAESVVNLNNVLCNTVSDIFQVIVNPAPIQPNVECWEIATFDDANCIWAISGTQPAQPPLECWETALFNSSTCSWEVSGTQPVGPLGLECWEMASFNTITCSWNITGTQPAQPSLECWETANFNTIICSWDVLGIQPTQPTLECWETTVFNNTTCSWDVSGTQPTEPTGLDCWEMAIFNDTICDWEITGIQSMEPTLECWEMATFNTITCSWEIAGTQTAEPTNLECWETVTFDSVTCSWQVSGVEPLAPSDLECWESTTFNLTSCSWEITGTQIINFIDEFRTICNGEEITILANSDINNATYQWDSGEITSSIIVNVSGTHTVVSTDGCSTIEKTIYVEAQEAPILESVQSEGSSIVVYTTNSGNFLYSLDNINFQSSPVFYNVEGGKYNIYVKSYDCDNTVFMSHLHFYIPKYFTPNNDGKNDTFNLAGIECFESSEVYIFNRYGKLLFSAVNSLVNWEGTYRNQALPVSDYWYSIVIEDQEFKGHFTLKR